MAQTAELFKQLENFDHDYFTPELFAWKLLMDDGTNKSLDAQLQTFTDYDEGEDPTSFFFEILLTIFMELVFGILRLNHLAKLEENENPDVQLNEEFDPILESETIEDILPIISEKFKQIGIYVSVLPTELNDYTETIINKEKSDRYCRIIYRNDLNDVDYFVHNADDIDDQKMYHMILNNTFKKTNDLDKLYATWMINLDTTQTNPSKYYKILFKKIEVYKPLQTYSEFD